MAEGRTDLRFVGVVFGLMAAFGWTATALWLPETRSPAGLRIEDHAAVYIVACLLFAITASVAALAFWLRSKRAPQALGGWVVSLALLWLVQMSVNANGRDHAGEFIFGMGCLGVLALVAIVPVVWARRGVPTDQ